MKPYEERKARERMAAGGAIGGSSKGIAHGRYPVAIAAMKPYEERKARERQAAVLKKGGDLPLPPTGYNGDGAGRTVEKLAEKSGVGARTIARAIKVREHRLRQAGEGLAPAGARR